MSISKQTLVTTLTTALDEQDKFNEKKYLQKADATTVLRYRGTVANFEALPASGNEVGDVYNIQTYTTATDINGDIVHAGDNVAYTGTGWDALGGVTDLSNYYTKEQVDGQIGNADEVVTSAQIKAAVAAANSDIKINFYGDAAKAVTMINGDTDAALGYNLLTTAALNADKTKIILSATSITDGYPDELTLNADGTVATGTGTSKTITLNYTNETVTVTDTAA